MSAASLLAADSMWELFSRAVSLRDYNTRVVLAGTTMLGVSGGLVGTFLILQASLGGRRRQPRGFAGDRARVSAGRTVLSRERSVHRRVVAGSVCLRTARHGDDAGDSELDTDQR